MSADIPLRHRKLLHESYHDSYGSFLFAQKCLAFVHGFTRHRTIVENDPAWGAHEILKISCGGGFCAILSTNPMLKGCVSCYSIPMSLFFLFLPITFFGFFWLGRLPQKHYATFWLVLASFAFYGYWDYRYVPLLFASILFNYLVGQRIEQTHAKSWLIFGIVINVILLGYFKYTDFFLTTANDVVGTSFDLPHIVLPLGISFFTFTQTGYLIDAYRGEARNHSFVTYCEFVTIFPHLIAGPILNHKDMMP